MAWDDGSWGLEAGGWGHLGLGSVEAGDCRVENRRSLDSCDRDGRPGTARVGTAETTIRRPGTAGWGQWEAGDCRGGDGQVLRTTEAGDSGGRGLPEQEDTAEAGDCPVSVQRRPGKGTRGCTHPLCPCHTCGQPPDATAARSLRAGAALAGCPRRSPAAAGAAQGARRPSGRRHSASGVREDRAESPAQPQRADPYRDRAARSAARTLNPGRPRPG